MSAARRQARGSHGLQPVVAAAAPATYASEGNCVDATHVPLVTAPATRWMEIEHEVEQRERARARDAGEDEHAEPPPALLRREHDHHERRNRDRPDLRDGEHQLAQRVGHTPGRAAEVGGKAFARRRRHGDEDREHGGDRAHSNNRSRSPGWRK